MQKSSLRSLAGVRILITRPEAENHLLSEKLRSLGAVTVELPAIAIVPTRSTERLDRSIMELSEYGWVIFTSVNGVQFFCNRMTALDEPTSKLRSSKIACIGPATAAALERLGEKADFVPDEFLSEKIAQGLGDLNGKRVLLPRADIASEKLPELLREHGAVVEEVVAYRTVIPDDLSLDRLQSILEKGMDVVTFTSPSTVRNLAYVARARGLGTLLKDVRVACIGPVTAEATKELGVHVDIVASNHTINDLVEAIVNEIGTV
jgi:uroporphyrinogen III methyltransferase/synthase